MPSKNKVYLLFLSSLCVLMFSVCYADANNNLGQTIKITTRFQSFVGKPSWLLIIRDLDHNQVIPYLYDIRRGRNFWLAFSYSRHYRITVSQLSFFPYHEKINNFCGLQNKTFTAESLTIMLSGNLTPNPRTISCNVMKYLDDDFTIVK